MSSSGLQSTHRSTGRVVVTRDVTVKVTGKGSTPEEANREADERERKIFQYVKRLK